MAYPPERISLGQLVLRRERLVDADLVAHTVGENLDHLSPWMPWADSAAASPSTQRERLVAVEQWWQDGSDYSFLLLDEAESTLLGIFGLHRRIGPAAIELGYWLSRDAEGKGRATTVAGALTQAALGLPDVGRVEIHCDEANRRSQAVPQRLGYRLDRIEPDQIEAPAEVGRSMVWIFPP